MEILVSYAINLDKGELKNSKVRAQDWGANDTIEDSYLDNTVAGKMGYESDPTDKLDLSLHRTPLSNPFSQGGNWFRKTVNRLEGDPTRTFKSWLENYCRTTHTVTLDNEHAFRKLDLALKSQLLAPSKFSAVPTSIVNTYDLAGKRNKNSSLKRRDSNETGPSTSYKPMGAKETKWRRTKFLSFKGSKFAYSDLDSSLDLDHWNKVIDDYLGTDSETVYYAQTYNSDSALDQSGGTLASEITTHTTSTSPAGTSDNPFRIESSPEKKQEISPIETPKGNDPRHRRIHAPQSFMEPGLSSVRCLQEWRPHKLWLPTTNTR